MIFCLKVVIFRAKEPFSTGHVRGHNGSTLKTGDASHALLLLVPLSKTNKMRNLTKGSLHDRVSQSRAEQMPKQIASLKCLAKSPVLMITSI